MADRIKIDARMIVGYQDGEHRLLDHGCVVIEGNEIIHVGKSWDGETDIVIDASDRVITPGLINTHSHLAGSPLDKSYIEDVGKRQWSMSGLVEMLPARGAAMDAEAAEACVDYSMAELLRTGTTTVMEIGGIGDYVADAVDKAGLRAYIANGYRSGRWLTQDGKRVEYEWDEEAGEAGFESAVEFLERIDGRANGRIKGFLSPAQVDTCTADLLVKSREASDSMGVPLALHVSQSVFEFDAMTQRHGMTPVEWLDSIGFLSDWNILGHVIIIAGCSWAQYSGDDLALLADAGASVAHCVWVFARRGIAMESFPEYMRRGVNMTLGTDTNPQSMIEALRWTSVIGKIVDRQTESVTGLDVFNAATINAAKMLHRDDLGRLSPGAKADLLFWDADAMFLAPLRDPIRNLVYNATPEDLKEVMIDGNWVVRDGAVLNVDEREVSRNLQFAGERMWAEMGSGDWANRGVEELSPQLLKPFEG